LNRLNNIIILTDRKILVIAERGNCPYLTKDQILKEVENWTWKKALKSKWTGGTLNKLKNLIPLPYDVVNILPPNNICGSWDKNLAENLCGQIKNYLETQIEYCAVILLGKKVINTLFSNIPFKTIRKIKNKETKKFTKILCAYHTASRTNFWSKNNSNTKELIFKLIN